MIGLGWIASPGEIVCAYPFLLSVDRLLCAADHLEQWLARESPTSSGFPADARRSGGGEPDHLRTSACHGKHQPIGELLRRGFLK
jgi:hypothetical protein